MKNRPLVGAGPLHAPPPMSREWQGGAAATDFLGLDGDGAGDFVLADDAPLAFTQQSGPIQPAAVAPGTAFNYETALPRASTLQAPAPRPLQPGATIPPTAPMDSDSWLLDEEHADEANTDAGEAPPEPDKGRRARAITSGGKKRALVAVLALGVLGALAAGGWYWKRHDASKSPGTEVAQAPNHDGPTKSNRKSPADTKKPVKGNTNNGANAPTPTDPANTATNPAPVDPTEATANAGGGEAPIEHETIVDIPIDTRPLQPITPTIQFPDTTTPTSTASATDTPTPTGLNVRTTTVGNPLPASDRPIPGAVRRATAEDMAGLWRETSLPGTEQIEGDRMLRTVNTGRVRALIVGGEYFEGNLYAVGQKRVWLELELGRISFESGTVRELVQVPPLPVVADGKKKGKVDLSALPHVEVHLPGGVVTGRLVGRDGKMVTLVTDDGMRAVFESEDVRPLTARNTRVLGTLSKLEAAKSGS